MQPPLLHLETFLLAAERGSFTAAARALGLSQAAVSQRIQQLEAELGTALFERGAGQVVLSAAGQALVPFAQRIALVHDEARQAVTGRKAPLTGTLELAASSVPGEHFLPPVLAAFRRQYPHLTPRVSVSDSDAVLALVEGGAAHLGLVGGKGDSPHLVFRPFACDTLVLVAPDRSPWKRLKTLAARDLPGYPLILRETGSGTRWCLEQGLRRVGLALQDLDVALELGSNEAIKAAVLQGMGLAFLSRQAVQPELRSGTLRAVPVKDLALERDLFLVRDRRRALPIPAQLFLTFLDPCAPDPDGHKPCL